MLSPFYGTPETAPGGRHFLTVVAAIVFAAGSAGCDGGDAPASPPAAAGSFSVGASERDAALEAIDRWLQAGRTDNAEAVARTLVERLPEDRHVRAALGRVLLARSGELRDLAGPDAGIVLAGRAAEELEAALALTSSRDAAALAARRSLGLALESAERPDEAAEIYRGATDDPVCRLYLGLVLLRLGDIEDAAETLETLARDRPDDAMVRAAMAEAALRLDRKDEARAAADEAVRLDPDAWSIRLRRASILRRMGRPRESLESLLAMRSEDRARRAVVAEIATAWIALERPDRAGEAWAERARAEPEDVEAALEAARAFERAGRRVDAETWLDVAALGHPEDPRVEAVRTELAESRRP